MDFKTYEITSEKKKSLLKQIANEAKYTARYMSDVYKAGFRRPLPPLRSGNKKPVVLVPGWLGRTHSFENLQKSLNEAGHPVYVVPLGFQVGDIISKSHQLSDFLTANQLGEVYVVAHSMGGLITITALAMGEKRIKKAFTLGSPLWGSYLTYLLRVPALGFSVRNLARKRLLRAFAQLMIYYCPSLVQMTPNSDLLTHLQTHYSSMDKIKSIFASFDQIIFDSWGKNQGKQSRLGRKEDLCVPEFGHLNLFMGEQGIECIIEEVSKAQEQEDAQKRN